MYTVYGLRESIGDIVYSTKKTGTLEQILVVVAELCHKDVVNLPVKPDWVLKLNVFPKLEGRGGGELDSLNYLQNKSLTGMDLTEWRKEIAIDEAEYFGYGVIKHPDTIYQLEAWIDVSAIVESGNWNQLLLR